MITNKYVRKPFYVDAVQVDVHNLEEIAEWCGGTLFTNQDTGSSHVQVPVIHPIPERQTYARVGDWVLSSPKGFKVYTDRAFQKGFDSYDDISAEIDSLDFSDSEKIQEVLSRLEDKLNEIDVKLAQ